MDRKKLYGRWYFWEELAGFPMMLFYWIKGDNIYKMLSDRINIARLKADQFTLTEKFKNEFLIEYDKLENFFSFHFKKIDQSRSHNFDDKIKYCLSHYKKESSRHFSSKNLMVLQENFLNGAEKTLFLYFVLDHKVRREIRLTDIMIGENSSKYFLKFLQDKKYIDENHNLLVDQKSSFIRIHRFLKDNYVINPDFQDTTIIEAMENEYNTNFDKGTSVLVTGLEYANGQISGLELSFDLGTTATSIWVSSVVGAELGGPYGFAAGATLSTVSEFVIKPLYKNYVKPQMVIPAQKAYNRWWTGFYHQMLNGIANSYRY